MCPHCQKAMVIFELEGIEVDHCLHCRGTWLDSGELDHLIELAEVNPGCFTDALHQAKKGSKKEICCPRCNRNLHSVHIHDDLELDECPRGHGIWFDQGEIRRLVESFKEGEEGAVASFMANLLKSELASETS